jgi:hypothetical protein
MTGSGRDKQIHVGGKHPMHAVAGMMLYALISGSIFYGLFWLSIVLMEK